MSATAECLVPLPTGEEQPGRLVRPDRRAGPAVVVVHDASGPIPFYEDVAARVASRSPLRQRVPRPPLASRSNAFVLVVDLTVPACGTTSRSGRNARRTPTVSRSASATPSCCAGTGWLVDKSGARVNRGASPRLACCARSAALRPAAQIPPRRPGLCRDFLWAIVDLWVCGSCSGKTAGRGPDDPDRRNGNGQDRGY
jgi:hypothetical protein